MFWIPPTVEFLLYMIGIVVISCWYDIRKEKEDERTKGRS
jgi:hypothetical protein